MSHWFSKQMLEFNFLPSYTLHSSRVSDYMCGHMDSEFQLLPNWNAAFHRKCSQTILKTFGLCGVTDKNKGDLAIALLQGSKLDSLAQCVGVSIVAPALIMSISGESVREYQHRFGGPLMSYIRRNGLRYVSEFSLSNASEIPENLEKLKVIGYCTLLSSLQVADASITKRFELKLPSGVTETASPVSSQQAWKLCTAILKDTEPAWYSSFLEIH